MKNFLKAVLYALCLCITIVIAFIIISNKRLPRGVVGPEAEAFTDSMMSAANCSSWERLRYVVWSYQGKHHYVWDKLYNLVEIQYGDIRVLLNANTGDGIVWKKGKRLSIEEKKKHLGEALKFWNNDSFWLNPICKLRDSGVVRRLVKIDNKQNALLTTFTKGGMTPGDSFLWITNEHYLPVEWGMWVRTLPIRGIRATWEQWRTIDEVPVATEHHIGPYHIAITNLRTGRHHNELGLERDPFVDFVTE